MKKTKSVTCCIDRCENVFEVNINCSNNSSVCPSCKDKGFKSPTAKKAAENYKKTMLEKYGVENPSQIKSVVEKRKQTITEEREREMLKSLFLSQRSEEVKRKHRNFFRFS